MIKGDGGFKSGFVAVVGRPNVGKSTLLNALVGEKVAIVSSKPQTTRNRISGILTGHDCQIIFVDTPGIHKPKHLLGEYMVKSALGVLPDVDLVLFVVEAHRRPGRGDDYIADLIKRAKSPCILVANKVDLVRQRQEALRDYEAMLHPHWELAGVSALTGAGLEDLLVRVKAALPPGPLYYPEDAVTDQPRRFILQETIREKVLELCREEVPHSVAVVIEEVAKRPEGLTYVGATVYVEKESQKGIVIGEGGRMVKEIGRLAREEMESLLGERVYLDVWVKVKKAWRDRETLLRSLGYDRIH